MNNQRTLDEGRHLASFFADAGARVTFHSFAGPHPEPIANTHRLERDVLLGAVRSEPMRNRRRQRQQPTDCCAGAASGAQLQQLSEEDECHDDSRRLEVQRKLTVVRVE